VWEWLTDLTEEAYTAIVVLVQSVLSLYIVVNPSGVASVFLGLTKKMDTKQRYGVAFRAAIAGMLVLVAFALAGTYIFQLFKITAASLQIAGGIFVFGVAFALARGKEGEFFGKIEEDADQSPTSIAYYPLAVPLIASPAAITLIMTLSAKATDPKSRVFLLISIAAVVALCLLSMLRYVRLSTRSKVMSLILPRVMGLILAMIAIQFIIEGIIQVLPRMAEAVRGGG